ncbi:glycosyltransferase [Reichenbachiella versicolor]|uniref:glycosyltransferase n=1 Tax=Reichenbachiella versicolor TaxID=1821036 RepID=UPI000D6E73BF|nr:glycosyltransferase [Reichenbachiella versicolor]
MKFSIIIPVYNRPNELRELLDSLEQQTSKNFEIVIVEDGSDKKSDFLIENYPNLNIYYFFKQNSGPAASRNFGMKHSNGDFFIFFDSDCIVPPDYISTLQSAINQQQVDAFGGADMAHKDFNDLQKAISYSMTSFFTTGGIRGGSEKIEKFHPRSFNMGYSRKVFEATQGFGDMRFGEDIDMSIRINKNGFKTFLIKETSVYHKRRTNLRQFYKQVYNSGIARINLYKRHPESLKLVHLAPSLFTLGLTLIFIVSVSIDKSFLWLPTIYFFLIFIDSSIKNKSLKIGLLSIITSTVQLSSYGLGFLQGVWRRLVLKKDEFAAFQSNFYE